MHHRLYLRVVAQCVRRGVCTRIEPECQPRCSVPNPTIVYRCRAQKYRLYLKRLAGVPLNAPISAEALQRVQEVQQVRQI